MKRDAIVEETYNIMKQNQNYTLEEVENEVDKKIGYTGIPFVYKYAIVVLGILALLAAFAAILMIIIDPNGTREIPESLVAIGAASVGALVGIFAPVPDSNGNSGK